MKIVVTRDKFTVDATLGTMTIDDKMFGFTCEDTDRKMESGGEKIYGQTAIPRGTYQVIMSYSHHFGRDLPEILGVPGFTGIRIHPGNTAQDTEGCILLGRERTADGTAGCADRNKMLIDMLEVAEDHGEKTTITVE